MMETLAKTRLLAIVSKMLSDSVSLLVKRSSMRHLIVFTG